jgi:hypothetical protein
MPLVRLAQLSCFVVCTSFDSPAFQSDWPIVRRTRHHAANRRERKPMRTITGGIALSMLVASVRNFGAVVRGAVGESPARGVKAT